MSDNEEDSDDMSIGSYSIMTEVMETLQNFIGETEREPQPPIPTDQLLWFKNLPTVNPVYVNPINETKDVSLLIQTLRYVCAKLDERPLNLEFVNKLMENKIPHLILESNWEISGQRTEQCLKIYDYLINLQYSAFRPDQISKLLEKITQINKNIRRCRDNKNSISIIRKIMKFAGNDENRQQKISIIRALTPLLLSNELEPKKEAMQFMINSKLHPKALKIVLESTGDLYILFHLIKTSFLVIRHLGFNILCLLTTVNENVHILTKFESLQIIDAIITDQRFIMFQRIALQLLRNFINGGPLYINAVCHYGMLDKLLILGRNPQMAQYALKTLLKAIDAGDILMVKFSIKRGTLILIQETLAGENNNHSIAIEILQNIYYKYGIQKTGDICLLERQRLIIDCEGVGNPQPFINLDENMDNQESDENLEKESDEQNLADIICRNALTIVQRLYDAEHPELLLKYRLINRAFLKEIDLFYNHLQYNNKHMNNYFSIEDKEMIFSFTTYLKSLSSIKIKNTRIRDEFFFELQRNVISYLKVKSFVIRDCLGVNWKNFTTLIIAFTRLEKIELRNIDIEEYFIAIILEDGHNITTIILDNIGKKITGESFKNVNPNIKNVLIDFRKTSGANVFLESLKNAQKENNIENLTIKVNSYSQNTWCYLTYFRKLRSLSINFNGNNNEAIKDFCYAKNLSALKIQELQQIEDKFITDKNLSMLTKRCKKLKALSLGISDFDKVNLENIVKHIPNLEELELGGKAENLLSNYDWKYITDSIIKLNKLRVLYLKGINGLSNDQLRKIIRDNKTVADLKIKNCSLINETILEELMIKANANPDINFKLTYKGMKMNASQMDLPQNLNLIIKTQKDETKFHLERAKINFKMNQLDEFL